MLTLDRTALSLLAVDLGDAEVVRGLVETYLAELPQRRGGMLDAAARGDRAAVRFEAHALGSSSELLGLGVVAGTSRRLEADAGTLGTDALQTAVAEHDAACAAADGALRAWLGER